MSKFVFDIDVKIKEFDKKGYTEALGKAIQTQMRQAAREWLRAVINEVPVYSGQARASLLPLSRFLRVAIPISPDPVAAKRYPNAVSIGEGQGFFDFKNEQYVFTFTYNTEVPHFLINDINIGIGSPPLRHPTPWKAIEAGNIAFREYMALNLQDKIPKIRDYMFVRRGTHA